MQNEATIKLGDIELLVTYDYEPAIKGGLEEMPCPAWLGAISARWNGAEVGDLITALDAWGPVEEELRAQRRDSI